jgi:hypothetical protein
MEKRLPADFREFLKLCNQKRVKYMLIGGYAVGCYGYPRFTADMDVWIECSQTNAQRMVAALKAFGFGVPDLKEELFSTFGFVVRMGVVPNRLEILTKLSGVTFEECYPAREKVRIDGIMVNVISLGHLKKNKRASGRTKDLEDLEHL